MPVQMTQLSVDDGRTLDVLIGGAKASAARGTLLLNHGTPSDATCWSDWDEVAESRDMHLVSVSRPGYATSNRHAGRTVASCADDATAVLDQLGVDDFWTAGWSGGGPHALACAALLAKRCRGVAVLAGVAPYGVPGLDFLAGMGPENVAEFGAAVEGEDALCAWLDANAKEFRAVTGEQLATAFGGLVPDADKDALVGGYADHMAQVTRRALKHGFDGWVDDDLAFVREWGFAPGAVTCPVTVWQGDLDLMVPRTHGAWLTEHVPTATARMPEGHGHISLVTTYRTEILDDLLSAAA